VSTQNAADTDACFRTYGSAVVQLLMLLNGTTTAAPLVTLWPVRYTTITEMLTTRATSDTCGAPAVVLVTESGGKFQKKNIR
jgi:hypothetical protein